MSRYITALMDILFTEEELINGLIIENKSTSKKLPLDAARIAKLK